MKYAWRFLMRTPAFSVPAVASLALGIAVNTSMFSMVSAALLRPLDVPGAVEIVRIGRTVGGKTGFRSLPYDELAFLREHATSLADVLGEQMETLTLDGPEGPQTIAAEIVTGNYFDGLRVVPALGRGFSDRQERDFSDATVAVISDRLWRHRFGNDPAIVGRSITLNNVSLTITGVAPAGFTGTFPGLSIDLWIPLGAGNLVMHRAEPGRGATLQVLARLRKGASLDTARAELRLLAQRLADQDPQRPRDSRFSIAAARGIHPAFQGPVSIYVLFLMTAVGLVLVVACANVAGLQLARGGARRREFAIRIAVGATRGRLVGQLLSESLVLALVGGVVGLLLAVWPIHLLNGLVRVLGPAGLAPSLNFHVDARVLLFTSAVSVLSTVAFGLLPAWQTTRGDLFRAAADISPTGLHQRRLSLRGSLIVAQVAFSTVLLVPAGLILRGISRTVDIDLGFRPDGVVVASFGDLRQFGYDLARIHRFHDEWLARVRAQPGVQRAAFADFVPLAGAAGHPQRVILPDGPTGTELIVHVGHVSDDYFATLDQPLRGRDFAARDRAAASRVAIVNEAMARQLWLGEEALGSRIRLGEALTDYQVVGVVRDGRYTSFSGDVPPLVFLPAVPASGVLHVRVSAPPDQALMMIRRLAQAVEPSLPPFSGQSMRESIAASFVPGRIVQAVLSTAGVIVLLLSAAGLYGLVRYTIEQRLKELGIRIALGATRSDVYRLVTRRAMRLAAIGVAVGVLGAVGATRVMTAVLYGLDPVDVLTFAGVIGVLLLAALVAGYTAFRAGLSHDPVVLLRSQ
jgi:predicted permease